MGHLLDWYTDPEKFQGEVNLKVIKFIDEITNFLPVTVTILPAC